MDSKTTFPLTGTLFTFIGSAHTVLGVAIWAAGKEPSETSFWFTAFGVAAVCLGIAVIEMERARGYVPLPVLAAIAALTVFGLIFEPVSGFLTVLIPLFFGFRGWMRHRRVPVAAG
ncbi:hypothetical protein DFR70_12377 [Nocardia tenerifensis]|uniref:Uncharacterized protein n=1 Tax=Nocardia tenerifensis TaxID=228006 RepID=A0A318JT69_9NOCA|nr:DUF6463 family protein [Nocardia tenerifensis]PXX54783.1 hypothetical protein DFR70_12377 [Nocardia tenerifensis]